MLKFHSMENITECIMGDRPHDLNAALTGMRVDLNRDNKELLVAAIQQSSVGCLRALLDHGADPNAVWEDKTMLEYALDRTDEITYASTVGTLTTGYLRRRSISRIKCVLFLVSYGARVYAHNLHTHCKIAARSSSGRICIGKPQKHMEITELFAEKLQDDINTVIPETKTTALCEAAKRANFAACKILIRHGADPNIGGGDPIAELLLICTMQCPFRSAICVTIERLLNAGAHVSMRAIIVMAVAQKADAERKKRMECVIFDPRSGLQPRHRVTGVYYRSLIVPLTMRHMETVKREKRCLALLMMHAKRRMPNVVMVADVVNHITSYLFPHLMEPHLFLPKDEGEIFQWYERYNNQQHASEKERESCGI
jgi:hypothetical protein